MLPEKKINKIVIVASGWSFILFTYIDDARSNTNQIKLALIQNLTNFVNNMFKQTQ